MSLGSEKETRDRGIVRVREESETRLRDEAEAERGGREDGVMMMQQ